MCDCQRSVWRQVWEAIALLMTLGLLLACLSIGLGCVVPDPQGGDNAPEVQSSPAPDAATAAKHHWELPALVECNANCEFQWRLQFRYGASACWQVSSIESLAACRQHCDRFVAAWPDCQQEIAMWQRCAYSVGLQSYGYLSFEGDGDWTDCRNGWPFVFRPDTPGVLQGCKLAADLWHLCAYDPLPTEPH